MGGDGHFVTSSGMIRRRRVVNKANFEHGLSSSSHFNRPGFCRMDQRNFGAGAETG